MTEQDKQADAVRVKYTTDDFIGHVKVTISEKEVRVWVCDEKGCQFRFKAMGKVEKSGGDVMVVADYALVEACEKGLAYIRDQHRNDKNWGCCGNATGDSDCQVCKDIVEIEAALELAKKGA